MRPLIPLLFSMLACAQPLVDEPWRITAPRVIGVVVEPAEIDPGGSVSLRAVVAAPGGPVDDAQLRWARCDEQRPFSQNEAITLTCLERVSTAEFGSTAAQVAIPANACAVFGPDVARAGDRPRDPDATGGYYQPVGLELEGQRSFVFVRLRCDPANVSYATAQAFRLAAKPNTNPSFSLTARVNGEAIDWSSLPSGAEIELGADWSASPEEAFPYVDPSTFELRTQVERYDVSWFVTEGAVGHARSSVGQGRWALPSTRGEATLWAVLRDNRGGSAVVTTHARWAP